jgi:NAD(P)H-dependent flavin oxidoreductase YrpB (nitropropane dioxygenase family)
MGVGVSNWTLANAVSSAGQLGVVSGTALDTLFVRRLQEGDPGSHVRRALDHFPIPEIAERVWQRYFRPEGSGDGKAYKLVQLASVEPTSHWEDVLVLANFTEVFLAKAGHAREVGINFLEKIQLPTLPSIYGALLAGVDYVLMGAGIPRAIPGVLDRLSRGDEAQLKIDVKGAGRDDSFASHFNPRRFWAEHAPELKRPRFLGIITSHVLAQTLATKADGYVDGFVVEGPKAGGHNAPPRGAQQLDANGEPIYGERDLPDLEKIREVGRPFWMAGEFGTPEGLLKARELGAAGVQVGSAFAYCEESGVRPDIKSRVIDACRRQVARVFTDVRASPTGFPFKVLRMPGTVSEEKDYQERRRVCDLGYLRAAYKKEDGSLGSRCAAEPVADYVKKGGCEADTVGRKCLCNGLLATIGLGQKRAGGDEEKPILTTGDSVAETVRRIIGNRSSYSAADVLRFIRGERDAAVSKAG